MLGATMTDEPVARCPFCRGEKASTRRSPSLERWVWDCSCGGIGVGAPPVDLDEAVDELFDILAIDLAAASLEPVGRSGLIYAQSVESKTLVERLAPALRAWGYELRRGEPIAGEVGALDGGRGELWVAWARKMGAG